MVVKFLPGFTVFNKGRGPAWVSPHSGPAFKFPDSRDERSDVIAGIGWEKTNGKLIASNVSRVRNMGIDFNRAPPQLNEAIKMHAAESDSNQESYYNYRKKYAWTSSDKKDYIKREKIYKAFWKDVGKNDTVIMVHRMFTTPKTAESLIDVFSVGFDEKLLKAALKKVNKKYAVFFKDIKKDLTEYMKLDEMRMVDYVSRTPAEAVEKEFVYNLENHKKIVGAKDVSGIVTNIDNFMKKVEPKVTLKRIFEGSLSHGLKNLTGNTRILQVEVTTFLGHWYPEKASDIICEILEIIEGEER